VKRTTGDALCLCDHLGEQSVLRRFTCPDGFWLPTRQLLVCNAATSDWSMVAEPVFTDSFGVQGPVIINEA
jgi:hypothetical protein